MNKKIFITICVVAGVFIVGMWIFIFVSLNAKPKQLDTNKVGTIIVPTAQGNVTTSNFEKSAVETSTDMTVLESNADYGISFNPKSNSFDIILNSAPLQTARDEVEAALVKDLGISNDDACKLTVTLSVPERLSSDTANINYGLSFCPNSVSLPSGN
jgi:hypothetical protein